MQVLTVFTVDCFTDENSTLVYVDVQHTTRYFLPVFSSAEVNWAIFFVDNDQAPIKLRLVTMTFSYPKRSFLGKAVLNRLNQNFSLAAFWLIENWWLPKWQNVFVGGAPAQFLEPRVYSFFLSHALVLRQLPLGWLRFQARHKKSTVLILPLRCCSFKAMSSFPFASLFSKLAIWIFSWLTFSSSFFWPLYFFNYSSSCPRFESVSFNLS